MVGAISYLWCPPWAQAWILGTSQSPGQKIRHKCTYVWMDGCIQNSWYIHIIIYIYIYTILYVYTCIYTHIHIFNTYINIYVYIHVYSVYVAKNMNDGCGYQKNCHTPPPWPLIPATKPPISVGLNPPFFKDLVPSFHSQIRVFICFYTLCKFHSLFSIPSVYTSWIIEFLQMIIPNMLDRISSVIQQRFRHCRMKSSLLIAPDLFNGHPERRLPICG